MRLLTVLRRSLLAAAVALAASAARGDRIPARFPEGLVHGFLTLRAIDGAVLADGDLIQHLRGGRVTSRLMLKFRDGSLHDETTIFTQDPEFRLVSDHLVQKGPAFEKPMEVSVDVKTGMVSVLYTDDGKPKTLSEHMHSWLPVAPKIAGASCDRNQRSATWSYIAMMSPPLIAAQSPPRSVKSVFPLKGPASDTPFLSKIWNARLTHWKMWLGPTAIVVSAGWTPFTLDVPSKFTSGEGMISGAAYVVRPCTNVQMKTDGTNCGAVQCPMSIDRDDRTERQLRVDRMITEFREAQARRREKPQGEVAGPSLDADATEPPAVSAADVRRLP